MSPQFPRACIMGHPVAQSRSPMMQRGRCRSRRCLPQAMIGLDSTLAPTSDMRQAIPTGPQLKLAQTSNDVPIRTAVFQSSCANTVVLNAEGSNVKTGVRFTGGKIIAPLAFSGSYSILTNCIQFKGTAKATVDLSFDNQKQTVFGQLNVDEVTLDGVSPIVSNLVTAFVRQTIAERLNPFAVLRVSQLALSLPIQASGGSLTARVKDVRAEVQEGSLRLLLIYDFSAEKSAAG